MNKEETINSYMADIDLACSAYGLTLSDDLRKVIELRMELAYLNGQQEQLLNIDHIIRSEVTIQN